MSSLNKVQIIGNMTADPETKETPNGQKVSSFSLATNRKWKDSSGVLKEDVEYHSIVAWRGLSDIIEKYSSKGKRLYVEGYLKTRTWDDQSGVKRYKTEIIADSIILLSGGEPRTEINEFPEEAPISRKTPDTEITIEDIPF